MTYKSLSLAALLLPFSGYAITKQDRQHELLKQVQQLEYEMAYLSDMIKYNAWISHVSGDPINERAIEVKERVLALTKQYNQTERDLLQEKSVQNK